MAKLILVDNYDRETVADILLEDNLTEVEAKAKAEGYNKTNPYSDWVAKVVADDYKLWGGMVELV